MTDNKVANEKKVIIRLLQKDDINNGLFEVLSQLTHAPALNREIFDAIFDQQENLWIRPTLVAADCESGQVVGTASAMIQHKFLRGGRPSGYIDDVVVDKNERGRHIGLRLIDKLVQFCDLEDWYKVVLDYSSHNISFYERCGLQKMGQQMGTRFPRKV